MRESETPYRTLGQFLFNDFQSALWITYRYHKLHAFQRANARPYPPPSWLRPAYGGLAGTSCALRRCPSLRLRTPLHWPPSSATTPPTRLSFSRCP